MWVVRLFVCLFGSLSTQAVCCLFWKPPFPDEPAFPLFYILAVTETVRTAVNLRIGLTFQ